MIAASLGCYGAFLHDGSEYRGDYGLTRRQLSDWHRPRLETLLEAGPDLLACETIPCLVEGEALARLLEDYPDVPAWLSFSCRDAEHLCHGERFSDGLALADAVPNIVAAGVNCTAPHLLAELLRRGRRATKKTLLAYPNSGESWDAAEHRWDAAPARFDWQTAQSWVDAGARWIGGCCRTTPETTRLLAETLSGRGGG